MRDAFLVLLTVFIPSSRPAVRVQLFSNMGWWRLHVFSFRFLSQVVDIKGKLKESKRFWSNLPDDICTTVKLAEPDEEQCWNSHIQGR